ncbi:hypothetical protein LJR267_010487 [Paraburkholderia hospita]|jgi:hypothetical protein|uniref:hypothetical protein n=1 Tax=Paraburkholderia hospita TaxID=169430 RepID=UPI003ECC4F98
MNVEEFLASEHVGRRSKISAFDADIRLLRSRGVSGQGIANFLKINNVHVTARAVYKYFKCHPDGYRFSTRGPTNRDQRTSAAQTSTHTDGKPATSTAASVSAQHPPGAKASSPPLHAREVGLTDASVGQHTELRGANSSTQQSEPQPVAGDQRSGGGRALANDTHVDGSANGSENTRAFDASGTSDSNYDRGTRERTRLGSVEDEPRVPSKIIHWDPSSPENKEALLSYREKLKAGTIPTGVITNSGRQSNERQEDPDHQ